MLVSIIIDNYNYGRFLTEAIESALQQTHRPLEVIVVDDGSTDDSREIIRNYGDQLIPVFKDNGGQASAFNAGFARSHGDVIIFLDSDDRLLPHIAQQVSEVFDQDSSVAKVHYRMEVIDAQGQRTGVIKPYPHWPLPSGDLRRHALNFPADMAWLPTSGNAFSATVLRQVLPIPEEPFRILADYYLLHMTALFGSVVALTEIGAYYRVHGSNNYEATTLNLRLIRQTIVHWYATHEHIHRFAIQLGLRDSAGRDALTGQMPPTRPYAIAYLAATLISLKLEPTAHPFKNDRAWHLWWMSLTGIVRRFDVRWPLKWMFFGWFTVMLCAPRPLAVWLAERWLLPEKRGGLNQWLSRFNRRKAALTPIHRPPSQERLTQE